MMVLKRGSRGALVDILQLALSRALGGGVEVDGCFGAQTRLALLEFQRARALPPTGEAGSAVWHALEPYTAAHVTYAMRRGESFAQAAESLGAGLAAVETANPGLDLLAPRAGQRITVPLPFDAVPALAWSSYANGQSLRALTARYPFLQPATFGRSSMGKPLRCLLFGEGANAALLTAAHHANEWITAPALLRYASSLAAGYAAGEERARELYAKTRLCFVPLVNPDGVDLVT
ncbi:MAG TPA: peptidoglycan-binding protein, partial [Candidatus Scatomorpha pullicola]|nr:peptidoglycan-binding protein [Candidatus Scatomorpha pullicola]